MAAEEGRSADVAREWGCSVEQATCHGCKSRILARQCRTCAIRRCARERGVESCGLCPDYSCPRIKAFQLDGWPHHLITRDSLAAIQLNGTRRWLEEQDSRWRCPSCKLRFEFYQSKCAQCGEELADSRVMARRTLARENLPDNLRDV
jgi:hypothetical protein